MRHFAPVLLASVWLLACGNGGSTTAGSGGGTSGSSSGGNTGSGGMAQPGKPLVWEALPSAGAPSARYFHTAVWSGTKMIVWGGLAGAVTDTGGAYDPQAKVWSATSQTGAPAARHSHTAVWTGSAMLVWGGFGTSGLAAAGGVYDPATDTWKPMSTANQPAPRQAHSALWTGSKMLVWGGKSGGSVLGTGGLYDPATDTWTAVAAQGAPSARYDHAAVWTGSHMLVWAGYNLFDWLKDGATFNPAAAGGAWLAPMSTTGAPSAREGATAVWTSSRLLVWGGWTGGPYEDSGGLFDPAAGASGAWIATSKSGAPSPRMEQVGVWTGSDLVVWGGCGSDSCAQVLDDGGRFAPDASGGQWAPIASQPALTARRGHTAVTTGASILVWGGRKDATGALATGAVAPL
jgi:hypothetical protein